MWHNNPGISRISRVCVKETLEIILVMSNGQYPSTLQPAASRRGRCCATGEVFIDALIVLCTPRHRSYLYLGMDQYLLIPFLGGWTSIYQLFWCSPGVQGFDPLPFILVISTNLSQTYQTSRTWWIDIVDIEFQRSPKAILTTCALIRFVMFWGVISLVRSRCNKWSESGQDGYGIHGRPPLASPFASQLASKFLHHHRAESTRRRCTTARPAALRKHMWNACRLTSFDIFGNDSCQHPQMNRITCLADMGIGQNPSYPSLFNQKSLDDGCWSPGDWFNALT